MVLIFGVCFGVLLLYVWLSGHWFARVLMTLAAIVPSVLILEVTGIAASFPPPPHGGPFIATAVIGAMSWSIASIPIWVRAAMVALSQEAGS